MPNLSDVLHHSRDHHLEELDGESVVFGRVSAKTLFMNETASTVWKLCDGSRSVQDITNFLQDTYPESKSEIAADVLQVIDKLVSEGLLSIGHIQGK